MATKKQAVTKKQAIPTPNDVACIKMRLQGKRPGMLMDTAANINFGNASPKKDRREPRAIADDCLYMGCNGHAGKIALPIENIVRCFGEGGRFVKIGRRQVAGVLAGSLDFGDVTEFLVIHNSWEVFQTHPANATGGRSLKYMPIFNEWAIDIEVELNCEIVPVAEFRTTVDFAGQLVGLGPMRPQLKRMHGRFQVTKWEVDGSASK